MIHVVLCDDHAILRRGIRDTLLEDPLISVTAEASGYAELRETLRQAACDVLLLDINMPGRNGLEVLASLRETHPHIRVLMVSMYPEDQYALRALRAGAYGYVNKGADPAQIVAAVRMVAQGRKYITAEMAQMLVESLTTPAPEAPHEKLSDRELQVFLRLARGESVSDIGGALHLSVKTISTYRSRLLEKLGVASNAELATYALRHGLILE